MFKCPRCGSENVRVLEACAYNPNTGEHHGIVRDYYDDWAFAYCEGSSEVESENKPFEGFDKDLVWLKSEMEKFWKDAENPNSDLYSEELLELAKEILKYHPNAFK